MNRSFQISLLILTTMLWGFGFIATKWTLFDYDALWANSLRYVFCAFLAFPILLWKGSFSSFWPRHRPALIGGTLLFLCLYLQVLGLEITSVAKSGFLTTFYVLFTPLISMLLLKSRYPKILWPVVLISLVGVAFMCDLKWSSFNLGDAYTLGCAVFGALHIIYIGRVAASIDDPIEFNFMQCFFMGIFGGLIALSIDGVPDLSPLLDPDALKKASALNGFIFLSIFSSLLAFSLQIVAQKALEPHKVALIFLLESPFAAFFAWILLSETLSGLNLFGAALVLLSVCCVPLLTRKRRYFSNL